MLIETWFGDADIAPGTGVGLGVGVGVGVGVAVGVPVAVGVGDGVGVFVGTGVGVGLLPTWTLPPPLIGCGPLTVVTVMENDGMFAPS